MFSASGYVTEGVSFDIKSIPRTPRANEVEGQKKQKAILNYVRQYYEKRGEFPPITDVALGTGYGRGAAAYHVRQLHEKNLIPRSMHSTRNGKESKLLIPSLDRVNPHKAIIKYMGGKCVRCGFDDIRALQIDHINGGGYKEQKAIGTYQIYRKLYKLALKGEKINGYQILCANCNWIKRHENKEVAYK